MSHVKRLFLLLSLMFRILMTAFPPAIIRRPSGESGLRYLVLLNYPKLGPIIFCGASGKSALGRISPLGSLGWAVLGKGFLVSNSVWDV